MIYQVFSCYWLVGWLDDQSYFLKDFLSKIKENPYFSIFYCVNWDFFWDFFSIRLIYIWSPYCPELAGIFLGEFWVVLRW